MAILFQLWSELLGQPINLNQKIKYRKYRIVKKTRKKQLIKSEKITQSYGSRGFFSWI